VGSWTTVGAGDDVDVAGASESTGGAGGGRTPMAVKGDLSQEEN